MRELSDLYVTALLKLRGHRPVNVRSDGRRCVWLFEPTSELEADMAAYFDGTLEVRALAFAETLRSVKGQAMNVSRAEVPMR